MSNNSREEPACAAGPAAHAPEDWHRTPMAIDRLIPRFAFDGGSTDAVVAWSDTGQRPAGHEPGRGEERGEPPGRVMLGPAGACGPWIDLGTADADGLVTLADPAAAAAAVFRADTWLEAWMQGAHLTLGETSNDILDRINSNLAQQCPCGAKPSEQYRPYCSFDCKPTHYGRHTDYRSENQMRWRPDLVSEVDDSDLRDSGTETFYDGPLHAQLFHRGEPVAGVVTWHLRLDDGVRFVGTDLCASAVVEDNMRERFRAKWAALQRELDNDQHVAVRAHWLSRTLTGLYEARQASLRADEQAQTGADRGSIRRYPPTAWVYAESALEPRTESPADEQAQLRRETLRRVRAARNAGPPAPPRVPRRIDPSRNWY